MMHTYLYSVLTTDAFLSNLMVSNTCFYVYTACMDFVFKGKLRKKMIFLYIFPDV